MALQWLTRFFGKADTSVPARSNLATGTLQSRPLTPPSLFKEYLTELEQAFFVSVMEANEPGPIEDLEEFRSKVRLVAKSLRHGKLKLENLPRRPASLPMLIKLLKDDDLPFSEIANTLLSDPALTARILKTANSPFFRISEESVESIEQAIRILGTGGIRKVISATVMSSAFRNRNSEQGAFAENVWSWALMVGTASDEYGQTLGHSAGTLHLLGLMPALSVLLIHQALEDYQKAHEETELDFWLRLAVIKQMRWGLCKAIRAHWGLSEELDDLLDNARQAAVPEYSSPLHDGMVLAMYAYLNEQGSSPLNEQQAFTLISAEADQNRIILSAVEGD